MSAWFVPSYQYEEFESFWKERTETIYCGNYERTIKSLCKTILFGRVFEACKYTCDYDPYDNEPCSQRESSFCMRDYYNSRRKVYKDPNWYRVWEKMDRVINRYNSKIKEIVGEYRLNCFRGFLSRNAKEKYEDYTRRERNELNLEEPEIIQSINLDLEEMENDPWQKFYCNKIEKGELECLQQSWEQELFSPASAG